MATVYLNLTEFAERIDIARDTLAKYRLPPHDAMIGDRRGWLPSTIDEWNDARPGRGNWGPSANTATGPRPKPSTDNDGMKGFRDTLPTFMAPIRTGDKNQHVADYHYTGKDD